ncbi:MAG TPA: hypothetical protein VL547_22225 [Dinghuibacter sp.]|jgi:hypothetical protein|uniref:hypothetical protein n=1 Tax=Dinghuibacter sp. TaxID=2024697 RepID=UPI002C4FC56F|nr:hypothetical protein [Dinghuibacter sp.]HTJ14778.1 hypothetical protein [Dinghuibacter sp.]
MKYSQIIGIGLVLAFVVVAWMPWIYIPSIHSTISGMTDDTGKFGKPALFNLFCCAFSLVFFAVPRLWAKRGNIFAATMNLAWALKNFIILSICRQGECPDRKAGFFLMFLIALGIEIMSFLPKLTVQKKGAPEGTPQ